MLKELVPEATAWYDGVNCHVYTYIPGVGFVDIEGLAEQHVVDRLEPMEVKHDRETDAPNWKKIFWK
jgi:hypothetical protein